jgi:aryl-alcohol dehydrogenase-like predicted oxidoreductase
MSMLIRTLSRRAMLETSLAAGAALTLAPWADASDPSKLQIIKKKIPSTGEKLPVIGIGTNAFRMTNYDALHEELKRMYELGGRIIETAAGYHDSETVIGKALAQDNIRKQMFIATKCDIAGALPGPENGGPPLDSVYGEEAFERSLTLLQTDRIDLMQVHHLASIDALMPVLKKLKKAGKIRYIGITTISMQEHPQLIDCMRKYPIDFVQVDYSLGNREAAQTVFPVASERRIAVMVAEPLGGRFAPGAKSLMDQVLNRQLPTWAADIDAASWGQFFLKYVVSHPDVTCAIPGSTKLEHLEDNQLGGRGRMPNAAMRLRMEAFWDNKDSAG